LTQPILSVTALVAGYDRQVPILNGVDIKLSYGEIVTIAGPNGSGKSTLLKAIAGLVSPTSGRIEFDGVEIGGLETSAIVRRGLGYVPQRDNVFDALSIDENLEIGLRPRHNLPLQGRREAIYDMFPGLKERRRQRAGTLSGGERQMLAMARALMPEPTLLLLDEPTAGLAPDRVVSMLEQVAGVNRSGVAVLMVEQNAAMALRVSHRGYLLIAGRNVQEGDGATMAKEFKFVAPYDEQS